jgi:lysophospholipase L1-like esterase
MDFREKTRLASADSETFETVVDELRKLHEAVTLDGSRLIVLFQPGKEEVYPASKGQPVPDPSKALRDRLDLLGIEYIDAIPAYRRLAESGEELFFPTDGHPNAAGYSVLAKLVADYIEEDTALRANGETAQ